MAAAVGDRHTRVRNLHDRAIERIIRADDVRTTAHDERSHADVIAFDDRFYAGLFGSCHDPSSHRTTDAQTGVFGEGRRPYVDRCGHTRTLRVSEDRWVPRVGQSMRMDAVAFPRTVTPSLTADTVMVARSP